MELAFYFLFVAAAIGGLALLLNRMGQGTPSVFTEAEARAAFLTALPDVTPGAGRVEVGGVLFALDGARFGLVRPMGRFPLVKILMKEEVASVEAEPKALRIRTRDFADPDFHFASDDPARLKAWVEDQIQIN